MKKILISTAVLGGVGIFAYSIYRYIKIQANLLKDFSYRILDFGIEESSLQKVKGTMKVLFTSNSDIEITVQDFIVDFFVDGEKIGYIEDKGAFLVPARSSSEIGFAYTLNPQLVFTNITDLVSGALENNDISFQIKGFATLKSGFIKVSLPIEYETTLKEFLAS